MKEKILSSLDKIFVGKYEKYSLFVTAFLDSFLGFIPTEMIVVYYFIRHKKARVFFQSFLIAIASILGGLILYKLSNVFLDFFPSIKSSYYFNEVLKLTTQSYLIQFSFISFFAFSSSIPFTWLSILLGILNINLLVYGLSVFVGRFLRFFLISFLTHKYGKKTIEIMKKYIWEIFILIMILGILYSIYYFLS